MRSVLMRQFLLSSSRPASVMDSTPHSMEMRVRAAQQVERLLVPQVDARLEADLHVALGDSLQQPEDILARRRKFRR